MTGVEIALIVAQIAASAAAAGTQVAATQKRKKAIKENRAKQKRASLIRSGENINMRHDRLPGDPNILA